MKHGETRVSIQMSEAQAELLANALELYGRIGMGQIREIEMHPAFIQSGYDRSKAKTILDELKREVFPDLLQGQYWGIFHEKTEAKSKDAIAMMSSIRHAFAWHRNPDGQPWNVHFDEPVRYGSERLPDVQIHKASSEKEKDPTEKLIRVDELRKDDVIVRGHSPYTVHEINNEGILIRDVWGNVHLLEEIVQCKLERDSLLTALEYN